VVRLNPARWLTLVGLVVLALVAGMGWVATREATYEGHATVFVSRLFPEGVPGYELDPYVATFQAALTFPDPLQATADSTGVDVGALRKNLTSTRPAQSTIVDVTFDPADDQRTAEIVPEAAALATLRNLATGERDRAQARVQQAQAVLDRMQGQVLALEERTGFADVEAQYADQLERLRLNPGDAAARQALADLNALRTERDTLNSQITGQQDTLAQAQSEVVSAEGKLAALDAPGVVVPREPKQAATLPLYARAVVGALLVGVVPALIAFALLDRRRAERGAVSGPVPSDVVMPPAVGLDEELLASAGGRRGRVPTMVPADDLRRPARGRS
jgi:hypothetical protein